MKVFLAILMMVFLATCVKPNPADSEEIACLWAKEMVAFEQKKQNLAAPQEEVVLTVDFCRVLPDPKRDKALLLVRNSSLEDGARVEGAFLSRIIFDQTDGWKLVSSEPVYLGVVLVPAPPAPEPEQTDAGQSVQDQ